MATYNGTTGDDTYIGTADADSILGNGGNDTLSGRGGNDSISGGGGNDRLNGEDGVDILIGGGGNDFLNGGAGGDIMRGGEGNDIYFVFSDTDDIREADITKAGGVDTVLSGIDWTLDAGFEKLTLVGEADVNGTGNGANNTITGNTGSNILDGAGGNDRLDGGAGQDILIGGTGNDRYVVNSGGDLVFERTNAASGGTDTVLANIDFRLGFGIENLRLRGDAAIDGTGNGNANRIEGNDAANQISGQSGADELLGQNGADRLSGGNGEDRLVGGGGIDRLTGGDGNDRFVFNGLGQTGDVITDFRNGSGNDDFFQIDASSFGGGLVAGGQLDADRFVTRSDNQAQDGNDRFIFDTSENQLWFDRNGNDAGALTLVATLDSGATVTSDDIFLI